MSYDAEALLQIDIISKGLNEAITGLARLQGQVPELDKTLSTLERTTARVNTRFNEATGSIDRETGALKANSTAASQAAAAQDKVSASNDRAAASQNKVGQSLSTTRTSLYDASRSLAMFGAATLALPVASAVVAASYQRDFATVERSLVGSHYNAAALKQDFVDLSEQIPLSFKQITSIAGAGAQLGLDASGLPSFTKTVAELTATTNLSADAAENLLGKFHAIGTVGPDQFANLASAVLNVGVHTAATEQQISTAATMIVGIGQEAGFTTPQIVGLAGALSSVSSSTRNPQLIRGTMTRFITDISKAVQTGGPALQAFADTAHVSADTVQQSFGTAKFAGVFQQFIDGLDKVQKSGGDAIGVLHALGITSVQDVPLLLNLANGHAVLAESISRANQGWNESYLLQQHFDKINDTLVSRVKELGNAFGALFNDMGQQANGPLTAVVNGITGAVQALDGFVKSPVGQWVSGITLGLMTMVGTALLAFAGLSKIAAGGIAINQAWNGITKAMDASRLAKIADTAAEDARTAAIAQGASAEAADVAATNARTAAITANTAANDANVSSSQRILGALKSVGAVAGYSMLAVGALAAGGQAKAAWDKNAIEAGGYNLDSIKGNLDLLTTAKGNGTYGSGSLIGTIANAGAPANEDYLQRSFRLGNVQSNRSFANIPLIGGLGDAGASALKDFDEKLASLAAKGPSEFGVIGAAMTNMANSTGMSWNKLKEAFPSLTGEMDKLGFKVKEVDGNYEVYTTKAASAATQTKALALTFQAFTGLDDKGAKALGDSYAKSVQSLTDFNTVMSQTQKTYADSTKDASTYKVSVQQFTDVMNANNKAQSTWFGNLTTLKQQVTDGFGSDTAATITNQLLTAGYSVTNASFLQQLVDAAPAQRDAYIKAMQDSMDATAKAAGQALIDSAGSHLTSKDGSPLDSTAIGKMLLGGWTPADIMKALNLQLTANPAKPQVDPKDANKTLDDLVSKWGGTAIPWTVAMNTGPAQLAVDQFIYNNNGRVITLHVNTQGVTQNIATPLGGLVPSGATGGYFTGSRFAYSSGGPVFGAGTATSDSVPAWLSNGEFVIKASSVRALGVDYLQALNRYGAAIHRATGGPVSRGFSPVGHYANGGQVQGANGAALATLSYLSPYDRQLLMDIRDNIGVYLDGKQIASSSNSYNTDSAVRVRS